MLRKAIVFAIAIVLLTAVSQAQPGYGQSLDKVLPLSNQAPLGRQELVNTIRVVGQVQATFDDAITSLAVQGSPAQIAVSEWLLSELDRPTPLASTHKLTVPGATDDLVRIFFLTNTSTPLALQELVNTIRAICEVQKVSVLNSVGAMAMRGTASQVATTEWLVSELDQPAAEAPGGPHAYRILGEDRSPLVHVYQLPPASTPQPAQELVNALRTITEIQRVVANNRARMIVLRGAVDQVATADWLMTELPRPDAPPREFHMNGVRDPMVQVLTLAQAQTLLAIEEAASAIRSVARIQRVAGYSTSKAIAMRGTASQIAAANQVIKDRHQ